MSQSIYNSVLHIYVKISKLKSVLNFLNILVWLKEIIIVKLISKREGAGALHLCL